MFIRSGYNAHTRRVRGAVTLRDAGSGTKHHHRAAHVIVGRRELTCWFGTQARLDRLKFELGCADPVKLDYAPPGVGFTVGVDLSLAFDQNASRKHGYARGAAPVEDSL